MTGSLTQSTILKWDTVCSDAGRDIEFIMLGYLLPYGKWPRRHWTYTLNSWDNGCSNCQGSNRMGRPSVHLSLMPVWQNGVFFFFSFLQSLKINNVATPTVCQLPFNVNIIPDSRQLHLVHSASPYSSSTSSFLWFMWPPTWLAFHKSTSITFQKSTSIYPLKYFCSK